MADKNLNDVARGTLQFLLSKLSPSVPPLSEKDAIENSQAFRKAAKEAWDRSQEAAIRGDNEEVGFTVKSDGSVSKMTSHEMTPGEAGGKLNQIAAPDDIALLHTHPPSDLVSPKPSQADIAVAKQIKRPVMVMSRDGLYEIDAMGNVRLVLSAAALNKK